MTLLPILRELTSLPGPAGHESPVASSIPHQLDVARTWTDACGTSTAGHGVPTAGIYIPRRCAHSPCEIAQLSDVEHAARLLAAVLGSLTGREVKELGSPIRV